MADLLVVSPVHARVQTDVRGRQPLTQLPSKCHGPDRLLAAEAHH